MSLQAVLPPGHPGLVLVPPLACQLGAQWSSPSLRLRRASHTRQEVTPSSVFRCSGAGTLCALVKDNQNVTYSSVPSLRGFCTVFSDTHL